MSLSVPVNDNEDVPLLVTVSAPGLDKLSVPSLDEIVTASDVALPLGSLTAMALLLLAESVSVVLAGVDWLPGAVMLGPPTLTLRDLLAELVPPPKALPEPEPSSQP